jgi:prevent-host-death family protein
MTKRYSIAEARDNLTDVVHEAEVGNTVELTRHGKPVAVLLSLVDYERLAESRADFWETYQELRREFDFVELAIDPDSVFSGARDSSPGRGFSW